MAFSLRELFFKIGVVPRFLKFFLCLISSSSFLEKGAAITENPATQGGDGLRLHEQEGVSLVGVWNGWGYGIAIFRALKFQIRRLKHGDKIALSAEFQGFSCKFWPLKNIFRIALSAGFQGFPANFGL